MRLYNSLIIILIPVLCLTLPSYAQKDSSYEQRWNKVEVLRNQTGLPKDALAQVDIIYARAKKENNQGQLIKALLYQLDLRGRTEENADAKAIAALEKEIPGAAGPVKSILLSFVAEKYYFYFQQHRWQLYNRTQTVNFKNDDIATWSIGDLHRKIAQLYLASIKNSSLLQQTRLEPFEPIIQKGNARYLRPTLYDLLAFRALDYFSNDEKDVTDPAYTFELKDDRYFDSAPAFSSLKIYNTDSLSLYHKALLIYQQLLAFHLHDAQPDALIDADIHRIQFVRLHAVMENKDSLYEKALRHITGLYENRPVAAQAIYLLADLHADRAGTWASSQWDDSTAGSARWEYIAAAEICKKAILQKDSSEGKTNCTELLKSIEQKTLNLTVEKVNVPGKPFRALVSYRNFSQLHYRLLQVTEPLKQQLQNRSGNEYWATLANMTPIRSWQQSLPAPGDYQPHTVEVKIDSLPVGEYVLLASVDTRFGMKKNPMAAQYLYISNISFIGDGTRYFVLDRQTGKPLASATVQQWWLQYSYTSRGNTRTRGAMLTTDNNGYVNFNRSSTHTEVQLEVRYKNDRLALDNYQYYYTNTGNDDNNVSTTLGYERRNARVFFFTDRGIYRPGQTIYFKGIAVTRDSSTRTSKAYSGVHTKVILFNVNREAIDSVSVTTNEYGSYSGKFKLPENGLNGRYQIDDPTLHASSYISVEEYKRPKFYVDYNKTKGSYHVNDSITVTGFAKAYSGNAIDGAQVKYRVQRTARYIYFWMLSPRSYPRGNTMEISNGVISTKADGSFSIRFKAIPDLSVSRSTDPVFDYSISADVTDINGETRSAAKTVTISYKSLQLSINDWPDETMPADSFRSVGISTTNFEGEFQPALVSVTISPLQGPARLIRKRYWGQPDQYVMSREAFLASFPTDEYKNESDYHNWPKLAAAWQATDSSAPQKQYAVTNKLGEGWYMVEATAVDKDGDTVKDRKYVQLYDEKSKSLPVPDYNWVTQDNTSIEPGGQYTVTLGTSANDLFVIRELDKKTDGPVYSFFTLGNEKKSFSFPVSESDRGGFTVQHFFVKDNRFYNSHSRADVPWDNKNLSIAYQSFRDKTLPGSGESWKLKISGYKTDMVSAELLAGMYDASLDLFQPFSWYTPPIWPYYNSVVNWGGNDCFTEVSASIINDNDDYARAGYEKNYDELLSGSRDYRGIIRIRGTNAPSEYMSKAFYSVGGVRDRVASADSSMVLANGVQPEITAGVGFLKEAKAGAPRQYNVVADGSNISLSPGTNAPAGPPQVRTNFNETAFFFPDLRTDSAGNISFGFTMPEALTKWKFQAMAHTKDLSFGYSTKNIITQKPLMVQPNAPRFLREGDKMDFSAKVVNMTEKEMTGTVQLELINAATNEPADGWFRNMYPMQYFTAEAGQSAVVKFSIDVPYQYNSALVYRFVAKAGENSDGEEASLPVLTNSMLVTESMPLPMRGNGAKNFKFEKLLQSGNSETLQQHALTVEYTSNPAWYAVQSLPYLNDYPYECAEQTFNRYYANALASMIANSSPKLKAVFDKWNTSDTAALLSNLQKNQELKAVLLEETPWVLAAKTEAQQKKNLALLFDMVRMNAALSASFEKLRQMQSPNGGFVWFKGGPDDRYITQYILSGIGHLKKLQALNDQQQKNWKKIISAAIIYLDQRIKDDYDYLVQHKIKLDQNNLGYTQVQYLYMRSLFSEYGIPGTAFTAVNYYRKQSKQYWLQQSKYMQGMIALSLFRTGDVQPAKDILKSLSQNAIVNEEMGMYWKENTAGYYWHQAPIETQSLLIEAFSEINKDDKTVDDLKTWLLKQKQVQNWGTTRATAEACYALLLQGSDWLSNTPEVTIKLGDKTISSSTVQQEAGTGYFKKTFEGPFVNPPMGDISVRVVSAPGSSSAVSWGAVYWQYFEHLDKITPAATPLKLDKKLFVEHNTDRGPVLDPVGENAYLKVGDKIKVRIELRVDRDMEYVHMKDMRASCMEPVNVLSGYKWQGGLGYYESTKDASTNFFFGWLPKGTYVFEYPLFVTHTGNFSNGITSIQCMYAPEFASHSEGVRVNVE